jgi:hypothetical protein
MLNSNWTAATAGAGGLTYPLWNELLTSGWQVAIAIMGGIVLALTIYSKFLEIRQRRKDLNKK